MRDFERRAIGLATMDEQMAVSCLSALPAGRKEGRMRYAPAIGIFMAEVIGATYGNLRVDSLVVEETPRRVRARGFVFDMQGNFGASSDVIEAVGAGEGKACDERTRSEIARIATAKARREAIFLVAPRTACQAVEAACVEAAFGDPEAQARSLARIAAWMSAVGLREERVWRALGVAGESDLDVAEAATLLGLRNAIADGDTTLEEAFPEDAPPRFIPPRDDAPAPGGGELRASAAAQLVHLAQACQVTPDAILDYIRAKGQGTYRSLHAAPEAVLTGVVRAWPDVMADFAGSRRE